MKQLAELHASLNAIDGKTVTVDVARAGGAEVDRIIQAINERAQAGPVFVAGVIRS